MNDDETRLLPDCQPNHLESPQANTNPNELPSSEQYFSGEASESIKNKLSKIKLFPIFENKELAKFSVSYCLYLEFFQIPIRIMSYIFLLSILPFVGFLIADHFIDEESQPSFEAGFYAIWAVCIAILFMVLLKREEDRLVNADFIHDSQWSEDQFSLLVEGLPADITIPELDTQFRKLIDPAELDRIVVDIILLQDCSHYKHAKAELEKAKEKNWTSEVESLGLELAELDLKYKNYKYYKGKAIVIFRTPEIKTVVSRELDAGFFKKFFISAFPCISTKLSYKGKRIFTQELPEPRDLLFKNIHYSEIKQFFQSLFSYCLSFVVILAVIFGLRELQDAMAESQQTIFEDFWGSLITIIVTLFLDFLMEKAYQVSQKLQTYLSHLELQTRYLNYHIYKTCILYVVFQTSLGFGNKLFLVYQLVKLVLVYFVKSALMKVIAIYSANHALEHASQRTSNSLVIGLIQKAKEAFIEFEFMDGVTDALPPIFIGMTFITLNPVYLSPAIIAVLLGFVLLDKYRMLRCNLFTSKSAVFMLRPFKIYRYVFVFMFLIGGAILGADAEKAGKAFSESRFETIAVFFFSIGWLYSLFCGRKELRVRVFERFLERKGKVQYEEVQERFSSFYKIENPIRTIVHRDEESRQN